MHIPVTWGMHRALNIMPPFIWMADKKHKNTVNKIQSLRSLMASTKLR